MAEIWVWYGESCAGDSLKLFAAARGVALDGEELCLVAIQGRAPGETPGADRLRWCEASGSPGKKARLLAEMARRYAPDAILFPTGFESCDIAAAAAALLDTGLSADCTRLRREGALLVMRRPAFGGGVTADIICPSRRPQMATVRADALPPPPPGAGETRRELYIPERLYGDAVELMAFCAEENEKSLSGAEIIVSGGLGVGSREGFALLEKLAVRLGGMLGASRAAVDAGYAPWRCQVGQTGKTVHPRLYMAFGISGCAQHIAGMRGADYVFSVNLDRRAPIFDYSDLAMAADWRQTAEYFLAALGEKQ